MKNALGSRNTIERASLLSQRCADQAESFQRILEVSRDRSSLTVWY
jgi:hypothetical protein